MIVYFSSGTDREYYNELFNKNLIEGPNPAQNFNYNIIQGLGRLDHVVAMSALPLIDVEVKGRRIHKKNIEYITIRNVKGILRKLTNIIELFKAASNNVKNETSIVVCDITCVSASIAALLFGRKRRLPCYAIVTDIPTFMYSGRHKFLCVLLEWIIRKYDAFIFLTKEMNDYVNTANKPYLIMEGLYEADDAKEQPSAEKEKRICIYSGAIWENSGIEEMIAGFDKTHIENVELHIYGDGSGRKKIESLCNRTVKVKYMGCVSIDEIRNIQRNAILLVNPRKTKGLYTKYSFPSKTMEYMASGTPVLMTRLSGVPDEYFKYVYTISNEDVEGFKNAFEDILSRDDAELLQTGNAARSFILEQKNVETQTRKLYKFMHENLGGK